MKGIKFIKGMIVIGLISALALVFACVKPQTNILPVSDYDIEIVWVT